MHEKPYRSIVKGISYRIIGTITTFIISYFVTGKATSAAAIGIVDVALKVLIYYFHERAWNRVSFGRIKEREPEYTI
jgi:uncharacterized membrane protein